MKRLWKAGTGSGFRAVVIYDFALTKRKREDSGVDALMGNTRTHPEHDG